jgi:amidase
MSIDRSSDDVEFAGATADGRETRDEESPARGVSRRAFVRLGALAGAGASVAGLAGAATPAIPAISDAAADSLGGGASTAPSDFNEATIAELRAMMGSGRLTSLELVDFYLARITVLDQRGPTVNSVLEINPDARGIAKALDRERRARGPRGPLHGIPIFLKDNIDTADRTMTTAGSLAMVGPAPPRDATVAARLRAAGAVILGKTNLSEWANFRSTASTSGWTGRGGQTSNPYVRGFNPCGSSSGSGAAVSANFTAVALGTETDGSIVCPASTNGVVGIKPTLGLTSRAGVIPIAHSQDVVGPHARTVADAAAVLGALVGVDPRDPATQGSAGHSFTDYTQFLDPGGLRGARIGVARATFTGYSAKTDAIFEEALVAMRDAGAIVVDPADIPTAQKIATDPSEFTVLLYEFKLDLNAYLATRTGLRAHTLADLISLNNELADRELQFFGQEIFLLADSDPFTQAQYEAALAMSHSLSREQGIDAVLGQLHLDALVAPTGSPGWATDLVNGDHFLGSSSSPAAMAGYPSITVPAGFSLGLPVGVSFFGTAWSEPKLLRIASGFEHVTGVRRQPQFLPAPKPESASGRSTVAASRAVAERRLGLW